MKSADPSAVLLTVDQAAARLSRSKRAVYLLIERGLLPAKRLSVSGQGRGQVMVRTADLEAMVRSLPDVGEPCTTQTGR